MAGKNKYTTDLMPYHTTYGG